MLVNWIVGVVADAYQFTYEVIYCIFNLEAFKETTGLCKNNGLEKRGYHVFIPRRKTFSFFLF